jgi:hypothetical protein
MRFTLKHGAEIDTLTKDEAENILNTIRARDAARRIRATAIVALDANGNGTDEVYAVPVGFEFAARRVTLDLDTASDPNTGNVALNVAGKAVEFLRSGTRVEYAVPISANAIPQIPGVQTWGAEQGPQFVNGEVFEVKARGLTPNAHLSVIVEGILRRPIAPSSK